MKNNFVVDSKWFKNLEGADDNVVYMLATSVEENWPFVIFYSYIAINLERG